MSTEAPADKAGRKLRYVIKELKNTYQLNMNVIAHSLGNRVLLTAMNELGKRDGRDFIDHAFLWEAAVPCTALSNDPSKDTTLKQNGHFENAYKAAKKITVLYSHWDWVLGLSYPLATYLGMTPYEALARMDHLAIQTFLSDERARNGWEMPTYLDQLFAQEGSALLQKPHQKYGRSDMNEALGYAGPDADTKQRLEKIGKLISANTTQWIHSHSAMRRPTPAIMKHVYEKWIMNKKRGLEKFGRYTVPAVDED